MCTSLKLPLPLLTAPLPARHRLVAMSWRGIGQSREWLWKHPGGVGEIVVTVVIKVIIIVVDNVCVVSDSGVDTCVGVVVGIRI